ncbi:hypothetical protein DPMN_119087 [Dreissena polymorpha]|uniref:Uncharacterized protein n=1 Tax=Dreissena polymorpha TaxID=45954 RepID=A0A9D4JP36_DREPO|nr:hypothetical protein DPMN_119087 [Dreissena polymorpha]
MTLHLELPGSENHENGPSFPAESTLTFKISNPAFKQGPCNHIRYNGEQRYACLLVALTLVQMYDERFFDFFGE